MAAVSADAPIDAPGKVAGVVAALRAAAARGRGLTASLAFRDLKDEVLLSLCLVCAIAAVLAPIMVLAGLKFGFIEILRTKFIQDPGFRLITPSEAQLRPEAFFTKLRARRDVAFIQPNIALSGTSVRIAGPAAARTETYDLMPTADGDPLILENGGIPPAAGEVTLTGPGAEAVGASVGGEVTLIVFRSVGGRRESQQVPLTVRSILRVGADAERRAYVALDLVQDIENFRAGIPVARRGWLGPATPPQQAFDTAYLALEAPIDDAERHILCGRYSFFSCDPIEPAEFEKRTGHAAGAAVQVLQLLNSRKAVRGQQLADLIANVGDRKFELLPVADALQVIPAGARAPVRVRAALIEGWPAWRPDASFIQVQRVQLPAGLAQALSLSAGSRVRLAVKPGSPDDATQSLTITVTIDKLIDGEEIVMHPALVGMLLQARSARLAYDDSLGTLLAADIGFRGFRLYAKTIDDVPAIARDLQKQGTDVRAKAEAIEQLQRLDAALTRITLIVAAVALLGGTAVLIASFYAAVERKKGDLSLLRLLGFSRNGVFSFPILQSLMLALGGFALALALFFAFAALINDQYATDLTVKGNICRLEFGHILVFGGAIFGIALLSSLFAANRTLQIDPAEALRQE